MSREEHPQDFHHLRELGLLLPLPCRSASGGKPKKCSAGSNHGLGSCRTLAAKSLVNAGSQDLVLFRFIIESNAKQGRLGFGMLP